MAQTTLQKWFPWTEIPFIASAPMYGAANAKLACEVTRAGGLGFIPFGIDFSAGSADLVRLDAELTEARSLLSSQQQGASAPTSESTTSPLPLGVGILTFHASCTPANFAANLRPILARHRPRVVWLFAPSPPSRDDCQHPHEWLIRELHALGATYPRAPVPAGTVSDAEAAGRHDLDLKVFVQTGHSAAAIEALYMHGADGIVVQGREAGGHQFAACDVGWSVGVPELRMRLTQEHVLLAAGGIATGAVVAAALAVGADGAVMGTRFLASPEASVSDAMRQSILDETSDSSHSVKSRVFDYLKGPSIWPPLYDGRALINKEYRDVTDSSREDHHPRHDRPDKTPEMLARLGYVPEQIALRRMFDSPPERVTWCGAAVAMVNEQLPAYEVVKRVQREARDKIQELGRMMGPA